MSVKVLGEGVNLPIGQRNRQINKLLIGKWLIVGMIIAPIEQVAPCKTHQCYICRTHVNARAKESWKEPLPEGSRTRQSPVEGAPSSTCCSHFSTRSFESVSTVIQLFISRMYFRSQVCAQSCF